MNIIDYYMLKESKTAEYIAYNNVLEFLKAKEEYEIPTLGLKEKVWIKKGVRVIAIISLVIGFILGAIIF